MDHNERTLHTILSTCLRPRAMGVSPHSHVELLESRLNEIEKLAEIAVAFNAAKNEKGD